MKKSGSLVLLACLLIVSSCFILRANNKANAVYRFNRTGILEITGTAQLPENVKNTVVPAEKTEELIDQLEGLVLKATDEKNDSKGWEYSFTIVYEEGKTVSISLSEEKIVIDGYIYRTNRYDFDDFLAYFT